MFYTVKIKLEYFIPVLTFLLVVLTVVFFGDSESLEVASVKSKNTLVIDPGHGGIDGGALSFAGDKESDINLSISLKLRALAQLYGENTIMTRENDKARTDAASYSEHEDLVHRAEIINSAPNAVLISVHQNCYPTSQPSGAQVLYASDEKSKLFGSLTHDNIIKLLEPENRRVAEPASSGLYITANSKCPAILVECGFMSNLSDIQKLKDNNYQTVLSAVLLASYLQFRYGSLQY